MKLFLTNVFCFLSILTFLSIFRLIVDDWLEENRVVPLSSFTRLWRRISRSFDPDVRHCSRLLLSDGSQLETHEALKSANRLLETTYRCVGQQNNQSCLFKNLYYNNERFWIFTTKLSLSMPNVRAGAFLQSDVDLTKRYFFTTDDLERFIESDVRPLVFTNLTVYFDLPWLHNIGHALFDGLYPIYLALIRFAPRHEQTFRILLDTQVVSTSYSFSRYVYEQFSGSEILNGSVLRNMSTSRWFAFQEIVIGSGHLCQRCLRANLELPGGIQLNGSRLFRDRMYDKYGLVKENNESLSNWPSRHFVRALIIDNKRFTDEDRREIKSVVETINQCRSEEHCTNLRVSFIRLPMVRIDKHRSFIFNFTETNSDEQGKRMKMFAHLQLLSRTDIYITGPGTSQMYQTFLGDGSVIINLGGLLSIKGNTSSYYVSFMEQYMTAGTPFIKGLYYPMAQRINGIKRHILLDLVKQATRLVKQSFSIPVNPLDNLASDGQLFVEMCSLDKLFCSTVTDRSAETSFWCIDTWPEDIVHENGPWSEQGIIDQDQRIVCPINRTLLKALRVKYGISL